MIDKSYVKFKDRIDALNKLLDIIPTQELKKPNTILIAISEGGLLLAYEISNRYNLALDFLFTEPILAPKNSECEVAIVSESMDIMINETLVNSFDITYDFIYGEAQRKYEEKILQNIYKFRKGEIISSLSRKNVIIIDDGIETGLTMRVAIKTCAKKLASTIIVATPVVSYDVAEMLETSADMVYSVYIPRHFVSTKYYYEEYNNLDSNLIFDMLNKSLIQNNKL
ncbi:phosphoribosyltransferase [Helicobacter sp. MIT 14-3879]|uniref:phosphoribosyltransferase n=1 Tax=Helicobacter sp. MIT 14-3879 TaxID=2040649 RepID=UPI000E1F6C6E|nr:phosphoribosyltransferase family protein [Helicobacter sp. MIT 14-3879]RDU64145.1 hypothetical protein CQA44_04255 [Helicobacter sp. MIT 14-3879]